MHVGKRFGIDTYFAWTRLEVGILSLWALLVTALNFGFMTMKLSFALVPIQVLEIIGTALAISLGFKNEHCFARGREALDTFKQINSISLTWAKKLADLPSDWAAGEATVRLTRIYHRHFAWLTALRHELRESRVWENLMDLHTAQFMNEFPTPEKQSSLSADLAPHLSEKELQEVLAHPGNKPTWLMGRQYDEIAFMFRKGVIGDRLLQSLMAPADDLVRLQDTARRIKNYPYPRNSYSITQILVWGFCALTPFAFFPFAAEMGRPAGVEQWTVWLNIIFSVLIGWVFVTLEKVGEHSANPFEGNVNDVPITAMTRQIEIEMLLMLEERTDLEPLEPRENILF